MPGPAEQISSPYDPEARYSVKRDTAWVGYKVHFIETCDPGTPHLIVNVETTPATTPDDNMAEVVHALLKQAELPPGGQGLHRCAGAGRQPAALWRHDRRPGRRRSELAGAHRGRPRQIRRTPRSWSRWTGPRISGSS